MPMRRRVKVSRRKRVDEPEIIVIPMIDVMMFLLFFFMVASLAMAVQHAIPVSLPRASTSDKSTAASVTITLRPDGSVYLNTTRTTLSALPGQLEKLGVGAKTLVTLNSDQRVPYGSVVAIMDVARREGVTTFGFATNGK